VLILGFLLVALTGQASGQLVWSEPAIISHGTNVAEFRSVAFGDTLFVVFKKSPGNRIAVMHSENNGYSWSDPDSTAIWFSTTGQPDIAYSNGWIHVIAPGGYGTYYSASSNGGLSWTEPTSSYGYIDYPRIVASGDTLFVLGSYLIHQPPPTRQVLAIKRSLDNGISWSYPATVEDTGGVSYLNVLCSQAKLHLVYYYSNSSDSIGGEICYRSSSDRGLTWSPRQFISEVERPPLGSWGGPPYASADSFGRILIIWPDTKYNRSEMLSRTSLDNGISWQPESRLTFEKYTGTPSCIISGGIFLALWSQRDSNYRDEGLVCSNSIDYGNTWSEPVVIADYLNDYLSPNLLCTAVGADTIIHCIFRKYYPTPIGGTYLTYMNGAQATSVYVEPISYSNQSVQNYPNPFNAQTTIRYSLPKSSNVSIEIFDIVGRKIEMLQGGYQEAGEHSIVWNAEDRASGVYFYRLKAGESSKTERCILLK
jgi:hypothetical protein